MIKLTKELFKSLGITVLSILMLPVPGFAYGSDAGRITYNSDSFVPSIINRDGSNNTALNSLSLGAPSIFGSWSPDSSKISYTSFTPDGLGDIVTTDLLSGASNNLTSSAEQLELGGVYSPNGNYMRYIKVINDPENQTNTFQTIIKNIKTGVETEAAIALKPSHSPTEEYRMFYFQPWSPNSEKLIVQDLSSEQTDWYVVNKDGSNPILISGADQDFDNSGFPSVTWLNNDELLIQESSAQGNARLIVYSLNQQSYTVLTGNLPTRPILMDFMSSENRLYFSAPTIGYSGNFPSSGFFVGGTANIRIYSVDYDPTTKEISNTLDVTAEDCPAQESQCVKHVSPFFSLSDSSLAFVRGYTNISATSRIYLSIYKGGQNQDLREIISSSNPGSLNLSSPTLYFNAFETTSQPSSNPSEPPPTAPRTGKLIGAFIATFALLAMVIVIFRELKLKHHETSAK